MATIEIRTGQKGAGKTLSHSVEAIKRLNNGCLVFSNHWLNWDEYFKKSYFKFLNFYIPQFIKSYYDRKTYLALDMKNKYTQELKELRFYYIKNKKPLFFSGLKSITSIRKKKDFWSLEYSRLKKISVRLKSGWFHDVYYGCENLKYYSTTDKLFEYIVNYRKLNGRDKEILIICDEAQGYFGSKSWQNITAEKLLYVSQSRRLNISWFFTTQRPKGMHHECRFNSDFTVTIKTGWYYKIKKKNKSTGFTEEVLKFWNLGFIRSRLYYSADGEDAVPDFKVDIPYKIERFYLFKKYFSYYDTYQGVDTIEKDMK